MKKKPLKFTGFLDEVDCNIPDYKTVIVISSKDQLNVTLSKCGLAMLSNLGAVREGRKSSFLGSQRTGIHLYYSCPSLSPGICWGCKTNSWLLSERWGTICSEKPPGPASLRPPQRDVLCHWSTEQQPHCDCAGWRKPWHGLFNHSRLRPVLSHDLLKWKGLLHTAK